MRIVARRHVLEFVEAHPESRASLLRWEQVIKGGEWTTLSEVQSSFPKAKVIGGDRIRFEVHRNDYRLIAAFDFSRDLVFIKFIGTHADYDRVDALTVSHY